jgi:hypothetical protein
MSEEEGLALNRKLQEFYKMQYNQSQKVGVF